MKGPKLKIPSMYLIIGVLLMAVMSSCGGGGGGGAADVGGGGATGTPLAEISITYENGDPIDQLFVGEEIKLDGSGSADPDGSIVNYQWDLGNGSAVSGMDPIYSYVNSGTYTITLTVTDDAGNSDSASVEVTISDGTPVADAGGPYGPAVVGETVSFDGSLSSDTDSTDGGETPAYSWNFGDGSPTETGAAPTHMYNAPSTPETYTVTLTYTDNDGQFDSDSVEIRVHQAPVADAGANKAVVEGDSVGFDGSGSFDPDSDGSIASYEWDWESDGTYDATGETASNIWATADANPYTVTLRVTDNDGATATDTVDVTVVASGSNLPPTADAGGPYGPVLLSNMPVTFDGSGSYDPDGTISGYNWTYDVGSGTGENPSYSFSSVGDFNVTLTVNDNEGAVDTDATGIRVHAVPTAEIDDTGNPGVVLNGKEFTLSAADSDPDGGASPNVDYIAEYRWDFDNDGNVDTVTSVPTVSHTFTSDGSKTIVLTVLDSSGEVSSGSDTHPLTVHQAVIADIGGPYISSNTTGDDNVFLTNDVITLNGLSSNDPDSVLTDTISTYLWDVDYNGITFAPDLSGAEPTFDVEAELGAAAAGNYTMALKVEDPDDISVTDIVTLDYRVNAAPVSSFIHDPDDKYELGVGTYDALIDEVIVFDASGSSDSDGVIESYEWDFDYDGITFTADATGAQNGIEYSYSTSGSYTVALRLTDNDGAESTLYTMTIEVPEPGEVNASIE